MATKYYIFPDQFKDGKVVGHQSMTLINIELKKAVLRCEEKLLKVIPSDLSIGRIVELLTSKEEPNDFLAYFNKFIDEKQAVNERTAQIYLATLAKIQKFDKRDLIFEEINPGWLYRFETFLTKDGVKAPNSRAMMLRNIRAVINHAINNDIIPQNLYPFRRFRIKQEETEKKGLSIEKIKAIRDHQSKWPIETLARDTWMLSLYLIGINNDDLYHAETITGNGRLTYTRAKTSKKYSIKLEPEAKEILSRLKGKTHLTIYPEMYDTVHAMTHSMNKALKKIMDDLTMYHARHSWATLAVNNCSASMDTVSAALGHSKKTTTSIYVNRDPGLVDKLNRQVLDCLLEKKVEKMEEKKKE